MYSPFFLNKYFTNILSFSTFIILFIFSNVSSQNIDSDDFLDRLDRVERNITDIQKGLIGNIEENITPGYISRNESRLDNIETLNQENYGNFEKNENRLDQLEKKIELINTDISIRLEDLEKSIENFKNNIEKDKKEFSNNLDSSENVIENSLVIDPDDVMLKSIVDPKLKYENAIKLLWSNNYDEALKELKELKIIKPDDLMPNIQYWLGEVFYAKKNFNRAILEFGEGLKNYPDSIKGPDNMLKLGLSFSNLGKKTEACNVLIELDYKYPGSSKDVLQRALKERKKLGCSKE